VGYSTTARYLHQLGYNLRVLRPWPERQNEEQRNAFLDQPCTWQANPTVELWFADIARASSRTSLRKNSRSFSRSPSTAKLFAAGKGKGIRAVTSPPLAA
jgi:hypothetical protein